MSTENISHSDFPKYLNTGETAMALLISRDATRALIRCGEIPTVIVDGRMVVPAASIPEIQAHLQNAA
jgi:hypothetical protein